MRRLHDDPAGRVAATGATRHLGHQCEGALGAAEVGQHAAPCRRRRCRRGSRAGSRAPSRSSACRRGCRSRGGRSGRAPPRRPRASPSCPSPCGRRARRGRSGRAPPRPSACRRRASCRAGSAQSGQFGGHRASWPQRWQRASRVGAVVGQRHVAVRAARAIQPQRGQATLVAKPRRFCSRMTCPFSRSASRMRTSSVRAMCRPCRRRSSPRRMSTICTVGSGRPPTRSGRRSSP